MIQIDIAFVVETYGRTSLQRFQITIVFLVFPAAFTLQGCIEALATFAHPTDLSGRHAGHQGVRLHILGHHSTGSNEGTLAHGMAADHGAISPQGGTFADLGLGIDTMYREMGTRRRHVGEYAARAAEHIVLNLNAFVDRDVVLHADAIADLNIVAHVHILSERAVFTNHGTFLDMAEMPDLGSLADAHILIDITAFMYVEVTHLILYSLLRGP